MFDSVVLAQYSRVPYMMMADHRSLWPVCLGTGENTVSWLKTMVGQEFRLCYNNRDAVEECLEAGVDVNATVDGLTPLLIASYKVWLIY